MAEQGQWLLKWDDHDEEITDEEIAAFEPVLFAEQSARWYMDHYPVLLVGKDAELGELQGEIAKKLREAHSQIINMWKVYDRQERDNQWGLAEVSVEPTREHMRAAREWTWERWLLSEWPAHRHQLRVGIRAGIVRVPELRSRLEKKIWNRVLARLGKELDYMAWVV